MSASHAQKKLPAPTTGEFMYMMRAFVAIADKRLSDAEHNDFSFYFGDLTEDLDDMSTINAQVLFRITAYKILRHRFQQDDIGKAFLVKNFLNPDQTETDTLSVNDFYIMLKTDLEAPHADLKINARSALVRNDALRSNAPLDIKRMIAADCVLYYAHKRPDGFAAKLAYWQGIFNDSGDAKLSAAPNATHFQKAAAPGTAPTPPKLEASALKLG